MTAREKGLWIRAAAFVLLIYSTLYIVRGPIEYLRARGALEITVGLVFLAAAAWLARAIWRRRPGRRETVALAVFAALFLWFLWTTERPEERLHLLEYGLLAGLIYAALLERTGHSARSGETARPVALWVPVAAIVLTALAGWLDEGIQYLLPNRFYDLRDVGLNLAAAALAVGATYSAGVARRRDRARR